MVEVSDDRGERVVLAAAPLRIVSLVPSTTETLFDLGLGERVVGVTRFCVHPADAVGALPRVGGTKDVQAERVRALEPDLIVGNCEENTLEIFEALRDVAPLYAAFPRTVDEAIADLERLGKLTGRAAVAAGWASRIRAARAALHTDVASLPTERVAYLIWREPWMAVGRDTFIAQMLAEAGLEAVSEGPERFPTLEPTDLASAGPDRVLLSSEPFPFKAKHADELAALTGLPRDRFVAVDGELVSWHGTRMLQGLRALSRWRLTAWPELP